ncbi:MAG: hypothetical protein ACI4XM_07020 [Candidatus Coprovivens sp.]
MPNNENKNDFNNELPTLNNNIENSQQPEQKPLIEIPQAYYDQLAKEEQEERKAQAEAIEKHEEKIRRKNATSKAIFWTIIGAIITYFSLYNTINKNELFIFIIPIYIVLGSIIFAIKEKKESIFPSTTMVGGMIVAVLTFVMSMFQEENMDLWTYYSIAGAITAFLGLIISNMVTKIVGDHKNIKALETIGYFLFFVAIIAVPSYLYINYKDTFYKYVFQRQTVVQAETEEEFVMKTLKNRYNLTFTCDKTKEKYSLTKDNRKAVTRICSDNYGNKFEVNSIAYNEGSNQYVVIDSYMDTIIINQLKKNIISELTSVTNPDEINVYLYPEKNCTFVGDCFDCDEYYEIYKKENNIENQFKVSTELNFKNELVKSQKDYFNSQKYKMIIEIHDQYDNTTDYSLIIDEILNTLNEKGYKNNYGYEISLMHKYDSSEDSLLKTVYKVTGKTNDEKSFKNPNIVDLNAK